MVISGRRLFRREPRPPRPRVLHPPVHRHGQEEPRVQVPRPVPHVHPARGQPHEAHAGEEVLRDERAHGLPDGAGAA